MLRNPPPPELSKQTGTTDYTYGRGEAGAEMKTLALGSRLARLSLVCAMFCLSHLQLSLLAWGLYIFSAVEGKNTHHNSVFSIAGQCDISFTSFILIVCFTSYFMFSVAVLPNMSWGSVLPSIVEMRDQNSRGCPHLFPNRNLGSFMCIGDLNQYKEAYIIQLNIQRLTLYSFIQRALQEVCDLIISKTAFPCNSRAWITFSPNATYLDETA